MLCCAVLCCRFTRQGCTSRGVETVYRLFLRIPAPTEDLGACAHGHRQEGTVSPISPQRAASDPFTSRPPGLFLWAWPLTQAISGPAEWPTCHPAGHATPYLHTISAAARQITPKVRGLPHACIPVRGEGSLVSGRAVRVWRRTACPFLDLRSRTCRRLIGPPQVMCALCYFNFTAGPMFYYMHICGVRPAPPAHKVYPPPTTGQCLFCDQC